MFSTELNRIATSRNEYQGKYRRVLCVCSAGLLRSPTAALVLSQEPFNFNTRAAGLTKEFALIQVDNILLSWADEIVCMEKDQKNTLEKMLKENAIGNKLVVCLKIPDMYEYRNPELIELIKQRYTNQSNE